MRAIYIEPTGQQVSVADVDGSPAGFRELLGAVPHRAARLPNGDIVLAARGQNREFTMGGSQPIKGAAIVLGKLTRFREHRPAKSDASSIKRLIRWVS